MSSYLYYLKKGEEKSAALLKTVLNWSLDILLWDFCVCGAILFFKKEQESYIYSL